MIAFPLVRPCALRGGLRSLRRAPANAAETAVPVIIVCAEGSLRRSLRQRKPATGSFIAEAGRIKNDRPAFSFAKQKEWKVKTIGHLPSGSEGHQPRHGPLRLRGLSLHVSTTLTRSSVPKPMLPSCSARSLLPPSPAPSARISGRSRKKFSNVRYRRGRSQRI